MASAGIAQSARTSSGRGLSRALFVFWSLGARSFASGLQHTAIGIALLFLHWPACAQQTPEPIRVNVDRVNVGVIVTDSRGNFVEGLRREDFHIFDNGLEQPLTDFAAVNEPAQVVLLIESGPAVYLLGKNHLRAAEVLLKNIAPNDRAAIVTYSKEPNLVQDFSTRSEALDALQTLNFMTGFGELNLASSLAKTIDWLTPMPEKKSIVLLSTGVDTSASPNWQEIERKLEISDIRVLAVSLSGEFRKPAKVKKISPQARSDRAYVKEVFTEADKFLRAISQLTGGRAYFPKNTKEFDRAYAEIAQLIRHEYSLAFSLSSHDGQIHSIQVKAKHSWYQVNHRHAYLAPASQ
jgi:Ca-activated chloride channel family protein